MELIPLDDSLAQTAYRGGFGREVPEGGITVSEALDVSGWLVAGARAARVRQALAVLKVAVFDFAAGWGGPVEAIEDARGEQEAFGAAVTAYRSASEGLLRIIATPTDSGQ